MASSCHSLWTSRFRKHIVFGTPSVRVGLSGRHLRALWTALICLSVMTAIPAGAEISTPPAPEGLPVAGAAPVVPGTVEGAANAPAAPDSGAEQIGANSLPAADSSNIEDCAEAARVSIKKENSLAAVGLVLVVLVFLVIRHIFYTFSLGFRSALGRFLLVLFMMMASAAGIGSGVRWFGAFRAVKDAGAFEDCRNTVKSDTEHAATIGQDGQRIRVEKVRAVYQRTGLYSMPAAAGIGAGTGLAVVLLGLVFARLQYARRAKERT